VLRYDAKVYERLGHLAEALLAGAAKKLTPTLEKAGESPILLELRVRVDRLRRGVTKIVFGCPRIRTKRSHAAL
jgi:hypothetical protein